MTSLHDRKLARLWGEAPSPMRQEPPRAKRSSFTRGEIEQVFIDARRSAGRGDCVLAMRKAA